jgi:class 3 adenylate cyclase
MAGVRRKSLDAPDEVVHFDRGRAELLQIGEWTVGRTIHDPHWRWSDHVKPIVGTDWCMAHHMGYMLSGRLRVRMADGTESEIGPGEVYDLPPGHDAWTVGDEAAVSFDFSGLRNWMPSSLTVGERVLATLLITDIVGSTEQLARVGDRAWRTLLEAHDERARSVIASFRGSVVRQTGDGMLVTFDAAARAIRCAAALRERVAELGIRIRVAVHTGEVELDEGDLHGIAVHEAARLVDLAGPDQVVVSATTRDLVAGAGIHLVEHGRHALKGLEGDRPVFLLGPG